MSEGLGAPIARICLDVGPDPELVRLARLVVSGIASVTPMGLEEVEDCRAAVDEMCSTLIEVGQSDGTMRLEFLSDGEAVEVSGALPARPDTVPDEVRQELSNMILDAVTDHHELTFDDGTGRFRFIRAARSSGRST